MAINTIEEAVFYITESENTAAKYIDVDQAHEKIRNPKYAIELIRRLGNPDKGQYNIKVTGSKGKGSVSKLIASILESQGYKVGLFTGPHLIRFNERIRINNEIISDENLVKYTNEIKVHRDAIMSKAPKEHYLGRVGTSLAIALRYFEDEKTDINILELGIGAKYDDGNAARAKISVINPIFSEHLRELGGTYELVADSKSYIIQEGQNASFWARQDPLVQEILEARAKKEGVEFFQYDKDFTARNIEVTRDGTKFDMVFKEGGGLEGLVLNMLGRHQAENAALALSVAKKALKDHGREDFDIGAIRSYLGCIEWTGRFEILAKKPLMVLDGGINRECAIHIKETLEEINSHKNIFIIGIPDDKDFIGTIEVLKPLARALILTKAKNTSLHFNIDQYQEVASSLGNDNLYATRDIDEAMDLASKLNQDQITLCIVGTQSLVADTKRYLNPQYKLIQNPNQVAL